MTSRETPQPVMGLTDAVEITGGVEHTCARRATGAVSCWGLNNLGQLGDNVVTHQDCGGLDCAPTPVAVRSLSDATSIAAGQRHTCAARVLGAAVCWGSNVQGQLGTGLVHNQCGTVDIPVDCARQPVTVRDIGGITHVSAGSLHACARDSAGAVHCWGTNTRGQLGDGTVEARTTPVRVLGIGTALDVAGGARAEHSCARLASGLAVCWGRNYGVNTGLLGQLGDGRRDHAGGTADYSPEPVVVSGVTESQRIALGAYHTCHVSDGGRLKCTGANDNGQLGTGLALESGCCRTRPTRVPGLAPAVALMTGASHTCVALTDGRIACWGLNSSGQLGDGTTERRLSPALVPMLTDMVEAAGGWNRTCAVSSEGTLFCWGSGPVGGTVSGNSTTPVEIPATGVEAVAAGMNHGCLVSGGRVFCWGSGSSNVLGNGSTATRLEPTPVGGSGLTSAGGVAAGDRHSCGHNADGFAFCWGYGSDGQLGTGTTLNNEPLPRQVVDLTSVGSMSAGVAFTCALTSTGAGYCWGRNYEGQLGIGSSISRQTRPTAVATTELFTSIDAGYQHACAVTTSGAALCWGQGDQGQRGGGTRTPQRVYAPEPVVMPAGRVFETVRAGQRHTCALDDEGGVWCWGSHQDGQLGLGQIGFVLSPTPVEGEG